MPAFVSLLRAINVGGHQQIKMDVLRSLCRELGFERIQTYIQSGNVVFWNDEESHAAIAKRLAKSIEKAVGFAPEVIVRSRSELETLVERNPFADRKDWAHNKLLVTFFDQDPIAEAVSDVNAMKLPPEEFRVLHREMYVYYPEGAGRSKFPAARISKLLKVSGTARNWSTVLKLLEMAIQAEQPD